MLIEDLLCLDLIHLPPPCDHFILHRQMMIILSTVMKQSVVTGLTAPEQSEYRFIPHHSSYPNTVTNSDSALLLFRRYYIYPKEMYIALQNLCVPGRSIFTTKYFSRQLNALD